MELLTNTTGDSYCSDLWVNFTCKVSDANPAISNDVLFEHGEFVAPSNDGTWIQTLSEGKSRGVSGRGVRLFGQVFKR